MRTALLPSLENARRGSRVDLAFDPDTNGWVIVEVMQTGRTRLLEDSTAFADVGGIDLVEAHFQHVGAAVSSRVREAFAHG